MDLESVLAEPLDWRHRWSPPGAAATVGTAGDQGWSLAAGDLLMPAMVLKEAALEHNLTLMAAFCRERGLSLAPHGKTTMAPQIWRRQLDLGAWGLTVASASQARICRHFGAARVLIANQVVDAASLGWLAGELDAGPEVEILCLADSGPGVRAMDTAAGRRRPARRLPVLIEVGYPGGRAGVRSVEEGVRVAEEVRRSDWLDLAGVEVFEGLVSGTGLDARVKAAAGVCRHLAEVAEAIDSAGLFGERDEVILSAGGSAFFDQAAAVLAGVSLRRPVRRVLRSGCYVTHDHAHYEATTPLGSRVHGPRLRPALELWAAVLARPERGLAIAGFGKRDAPYDRELPVPLAVRRGAATLPADGVAVLRLDDQHAHLGLESGADLQVGDLVAFGVSHPCTAFDKWRSLPLVDEELRVTGAILTFF